MLHLPVELRHHVVDPPHAGPLGAVGIEGIIALQAVGVAALGVGFLVAPYSEGTYSEAHPGLDAGDGAVHRGDERVDIGPAPVALVLPVAVAGVAGGVGKVGVLDGIGIKIVVHVQAVDVVAGHDVGHHAVDEVAALGIGWVEVVLLAVFQEPLGMLAQEGTVAYLRLRAHSVGIDPRVQLKSALVSFGHHKLHRVPVGVGGLSGLAA